MKVLSVILIFTSILHANGDITEEDIKDTALQLREDEQRYFRFYFASVIGFVSQQLIIQSDPQQQKFLTDLVNSLHANIPELTELMKPYEEQYGSKTGLVDPGRKMELISDLFQCLEGSPEPTDPAVAVKTFMAEKQTSFKTHIAPYRVLQGAVDAAVIKHVANGHFCLYTIVQSLLCPKSVADTSGGMFTTWIPFTTAKSIPKHIETLKQKVKLNLIPHLLHQRLSTTDPEKLLKVFDDGYNLMQAGALNGDFPDEAISESSRTDDTANIAKFFEACLDDQVANTDPKYYPEPQRSCFDSPPIKEIMGRFADHVSKQTFFANVAVCRWRAEKEIPDNFDRDITDEDKAKWGKSWKDGQQKVHLRREKNLLKLEEKTEETKDEANPVRQE